MGTGPESAARSESPRRRFRLSLRSMMLVVLVVGVALGSLGRQIDRERRLAHARAAVPAQSGVAEATLQGPLKLLWNTSAATGASFGTNSGPDHWEVRVRSYMVGRDKSTNVLLDLRLSGGIGDVDLRPIRIEDRGAQHNGEAIDTLTRAFREQGWDVVVVATTPADAEAESGAERLDRGGPS